MVLFLLTSLVCLFLTEGEHTLTKTIVTSKIGKLASFTKKRSTCIGCKALLDDEGDNQRSIASLHKAVFSNYGWHMSEVCKHKTSLYEDGFILDI